jgi:alpha-tubulin suppressor-like RCC1 family protein
MLEAIFGFSNHHQRIPDQEERSFSFSAADDATELSVSTASVKISQDGCCEKNIISDVYSWGTSMHGELGRNARRNDKIPRLVGDLQGKGIIDIACGDRRTIALDSGGNVYLWGRKFGRNIDENLRFRPRMFLWTDISMDPVKLDFAIPVEKIYCGHTHAMLLCENGKSLYAMGVNKFGQLGIGNETSCSLPKKVSFQFPSRMDTRNYRIEEVSLGKFHSICLLRISKNGLNSNFVYAWGRGSDGALGYGQTADLRQPHLLKDLLNPIKVSAGDTHSAVSLYSGDVFVFGTFHMNLRLISAIKINVEPNLKLRLLSSGKFHSYFIEGKHLLTFFI